MPQVETDGCEQQRERNGKCDDQGSAHVAEEQEQNDHHQDDALGQVVQDGVSGVVDQVATVEERNDLHSPRQDVIVQLFDLGVNRVERGVRLGALAKQDD